MSAGDAGPDSDALRALYGRVDPEPEGSPAPGRGRACLCVDVGDPDDVAAAERWMLAHADRLTRVRSTGCGCCVIGWDIEGPAALIATLPASLGAVSDWAAPVGAPRRAPIVWGRRLWDRCVRRG
ncbi:hypothetical protein [Methylobacterium radiotolerans]|uniref:hypothetical protein n=1 Tax=Methylobacterium radiotolerans TaxID=31998 RepID=UPI000465A372|nr:hypothetical protein [Methylobacterium radiotolerans]MCX4197866.1 hypothetical protein [Methylobacterium organophilum]UIY43579.1 hypothetical protein LZ599_07750 [Methylobacterium radiotolerans]